MGRKKMISNKDVLRFETRKKIYHFIKNNPGLHLRELVRLTKIPKTTLKYHLMQLQKLDLINKKNDSKKCLFYPTDKLGSQEKKILMLLRKKIPCRIYLHLLTDIIVSASEISRDLEITPSTVIYHLKKMVEMGFLEEAPYKNGKLYPFPGENYHYDRKPVTSEKFYRRTNQDLLVETYRIMIKYKDTLPDKELIEIYEKQWDEIQKYHKESGKSNTDNNLHGNDRLDVFLNIIKEIFPPPYQIF